jgi:hypothetical protein
MVQLLWKTFWQFLIKNTPHDLTVLFKGVSRREMKVDVHESNADNQQ